MSGPAIWLVVGLAAMEGAVVRVLHAGRAQPAAVHLYFLGRARSGTGCRETLSKTLPIGIKRLPAHPAGGDERRGRNTGGDRDAVLSKGRRSHSLRRDRLWLPAAGHSRWRPEFARRQ